MRSLRARLWLLWALIAVASAVVGGLLFQLYRASAAAELQRAEAVVARSCEGLRERYAFWARNWDGGGFSAGDPGLRRELHDVVLSVLLRQRGLAGGIAQGAITLAEAGRPPGGAPSEDEAETIAAASQSAARSEQTVTDSLEEGDDTVLVAACPLGGPVSGLTGWISTRVQVADDADPLRRGIAVLLLLVLGIAGWLAWLTAVWGRRVGEIETALARRDLAAWPVLRPTGERELDRIVGALNEAGRRLAAAAERSAALASRMAQSERLAALGRVAAGVAHEIRNPMAALRLKAENALAGDDERRRRALEASLVQIARIDRLIAELLAMTQRRPPQQQRLDLAAYLAARVEEHREAAQRQGIDLTVAAPEGLAAFFDPELIGRALDNLILNALQHTPRSGRIGITAAAPADAVSIAVADSGPGVAPDIAARLFEPFATGRPDGTGLGLAIARELAEAHGGRLDWRPGETGATFVLTLPLDGPQDPLRPEASGQEQGNRVNDISA